MRLDSIDVKILEALLRDGRISYRLIAKELNVSPPTISSKIEKLLDLGVIKGYTAVVDHTKFGQTLAIVVMDHVVKDVMSLEPIRVLYKTADGRFLAICSIESLEELHDTLSYLREHGINFEYYLLVGNPIKEEPIARIRDNIPIKIKCANCGELIEGEPVKKTIMRKVYYFCSERCYEEFSKSKTVL